VSRNGKPKALNQHVGTRLEIDQKTRVNTAGGTQEEKKQDVLEAMPPEVGAAGPRVTLKIFTL